MLLLTDEDRQYLNRGLLPAARRLDVPDDLRGWSWSRAPLEPTYPVRLAVYEVASQYCATARDLYLRRVCGVRTAPSEEMRRGGELHDLITAVFVTAKRRIYEQPSGSADALRGIGEEVLGRGESTSPDGRLLVHHVEDLLVADAARVLSAQPRIEPDALAARVVPAVFAVRLDGGVFGLSPHLVADAIAIPWPMVIDFKFGPIEPFHRLSTVGYGLAFEATYEVPVNAGVIISFSFDRNRVAVAKDFHLFDAELRQWFIESRDERARMLYHEQDPGLPERHPASCPYLTTCGVAPTQQPSSRGTLLRRQRPAGTADAGRIIAFPGAPATDEP